MELGIPEEWVELLKELGYDSAGKLKADENPGRLHQKMMGYPKRTNWRSGR